MHLVNSTIPQHGTYHWRRSRGVGSVHIHLCQHQVTPADGVVIVIKEDVVNEVFSSLVSGCFCCQWSCNIQKSCNLMPNSCQSPRWQHSCVHAPYWMTWWSSKVVLTSLYYHNHEKSCFFEVPSITCLDRSPLTAIILHHLQSLHTEPLYPYFRWKTCRREM